MYPVGQRKWVLHPVLHSLSPGSVLASVRAAYVRTETRKLLTRTRLGLVVERFRVGTASRFTLPSETPSSRALFALGGKVG